MAKANTKPAPQATVNNDNANVTIVCGSLTEAKLKVMEMVPYIQKTQPKESGLRFAFAAEEAIIGKLNPAMRSCGLTITPVKVEVVKRDTYVTGKNATMHSTVVMVIYELTHITGGKETIASLGEGADIGDKSLPKAMTGAYKYALRQAFLLETGNDPDWTPSENYAQTGTGSGGSSASGSGSQAGGNYGYGGDGGYGPPDDLPPDPVAPPRQQQAARGPDKQPAPTPTTPTTPTGTPPANQQGPGPQAGPNRPVKATPEATERYNQRLAGIARSKEVKTIDKYRDCYMADREMTTDMIGGLEAAYFKRKAEIGSTS